MSGPSLRPRFLAAFLVVVASALAAGAISILLVSPGYFADAMGHLPGDPMGAAMDAVTREAFVHAMQRSLAAATITATATAVVVSLAVTARVTRPVTRLSVAAERIAAGHYTERVADDEPGELRRLAVSFNEMAASLESTERRRLQLVGDVAHELRTPLTTLDGYLEGLEDGVIQPGAQTWHLLRAETGRLTRLVADLAELWRAEAHQLVLRPEAVDAFAAAHAIVDSFRPQAQARRIRLEVVGSRAVAWADPDRLRQILANYVSNAIRHAPEDSVVAVSIGMSVDSIRLSVRDEGPGLAADQLEAVFERFYRVDPARSRVDGGSGIGLAIVRALAAAMGGVTWAESAGPGTGATFHVEVPIA